MASYIEVIFNSQPAVDTQLTIIDSLTGISMIETFKNVRAGIGQSALGVDVDHASFNYNQAFETDYNTSLLYSIDYDLPTTTITIYGVNAGSQFSVDSNTTAGAVTTNIVNEAPPSTFAFSSVAVSEADSSPCDNVKLTVTMSEQADSISSPISQAVATNPFVFDTLRTDSVSISMVLGAVTSTKKYRIPKLLSAYIKLNIVNTPGGATLSVIRLFPLSSTAISGVTFPLTFQYSLNNVTWQTSNSWSGLSVGDYTVYIKDNIGCQISIDFTVDAFTPNLVDYDPIFEIPTLNSIRFKESIVWSDALPKTIDNTLSFEEDTKRVHRSFLQPFQTNDPIQKIQIKSNYDTNEAVLIDCDGNETPLTPVVVTENMDKTDVRDAFIVNFVGDSNDGRLGVYFGAGDTYNSITLLAEDSYNLNGDIMTWINAGDYVGLQGIGWLLVEDIIPIPDYIPFTGKVLVLNALHADYGLTNQATIQCTTVYNIQDFERYEFPVDFTSLDGYYKIKINSSDTDINYPDKEYISEWLTIKDEHCKMYVIDYYNSENNTINFYSGIQYRLRVPYIDVLKRKPNNNQDNYETDTSTIKLESRLRKFYDFKAMPLPNAMADLLELILSQDRLFIAGESYLTEGEIELSPVGDSNLVLVAATLVKADYVFESNSGIGIGESVFTPAEPLQVDPNAPGLLFLD